MPNYEKMYFALFNELTEALGTLQVLEQATREMQEEIAGCMAHLQGTQQAAQAVLAEEGASFPDAKSLAGFLHAWGNFMQTAKDNRENAETVQL